MPSSAFASGFIDSFVGGMEKERDRRANNTKDAINFLVSTGRVRDYNDLMPLVDSLFTPQGGISATKQNSRGGKGGGGGASGQPDVHGILAQFLNPAFKMQADSNAQNPATDMTAGGQHRPSFGPPLTAEQATQPVGAPPQKPLMGNEELQSLADTKQRHAAEIQYEFEKRKLADVHTNRLTEIAEQNKGKYGPGTLQGRVNAAVEAFTSANGRPPTDEEYPGLIDQARSAWQSAGKKVTDPEAFTKSWMADAAQEAGGTLTAGQEKLERLKAAKAWALAKQSDTPADKMSRAMVMAKFRNDLQSFDSSDLQQLSQSVSMGNGDQKPYLDLGTFSGKEKIKAASDAIAQGIVPVTPKQVQVLESAQTTRQNIDGFLGQIKSKLPANYASRPLTGIENKLSQYFQTDDDLAAAAAWDTTVLPMLRTIAQGGLGHVTNKELTLVEHARPLLTDTVATAAKKAAIVNTILDNAVNPILTRGGGTTAAGGASTPTKPKPSAGNDGTTPPPTPALRTKARQHLLDAQKAGKIPATVKIDDASIDKFISANPSFK